MGNGAGDGFGRTIDHRDDQRMGEVVLTLRDASRTVENPLRPRERHIIARVRPDGRERGASISAVDNVI